MRFELRAFYHLGSGAFGKPQDRILTPPTPSSSLCRTGLRPSPACRRKPCFRRPPRQLRTRRIFRNTLRLTLSGTPEPDPAVEPSPTPEPPHIEAPTVILGGGTGLPDATSTYLKRVVELPTTEVVKTLIPSVVNITTEIAGTGVLPPGGVGTGVIIDTAGHILTIDHVLVGARSTTVTLYDGADYSAEIVGRDPATDLAVIKIDAVGLVPATLGKSSDLLVGEDVVAIGYALGFEGAPTVSKGVVSALGRTIDTDQNITMGDLIQTDASVNPGNSGGPLVNNRAEVIGINTAIIRGVQGIGFAINIDDATVVAQQLVDRGFVRRGYMGVLPDTLNPILAIRLGLDADVKGVLLRQVIPNTPAGDAGLQAGDVIIEMGGQTLRNTARSVEVPDVAPVGRHPGHRRAQEQRRGDGHSDLGRKTGHLRLLG